MFFKLYRNFLRLVVRKPPSEDSLISLLSDSYGAMWFCEPPTYSGWCKVADIQLRGTELLAIVEHTTVDVDGVEDLLRPDALTATVWRYELQLAFTLKKWGWNFVCCELVDEFSTVIQDSEDLDTCYKMIFQRIDWDDYLTYSEKKSAELLASFKPTQRKHYEPIHADFVQREEFV